MPTCLLDKLCPFCLHYGNITMSKKKKKKGLEALVYTNNEKFITYIALEIHTRVYSTNLVRRVDATHRIV